MIFSRLTHHPKPGQWLDEYQLHAAIAKLASDQDQGSTGRYLYRQDRAQPQRFYLLSNTEPQQFDDTWRVESKSYAPKLASGQQLQFSLRANPVVTKTVDGKQRRHDVVMDLKRQRNAQGNTLPQAQIEQQAGLAWLGIRQAGLGFRIDEESLMITGYTQHELRKRGGRVIRFSTLDFDGQLTVTDSAALLKALHNGIGPAKGFGCGMLLLRRSA